MRDGRLWVMVGLALCGAGIVALSLTGHTQAQETQAVSAEDRETPGALVATDKEGKPLGLCPLKHTDVKVEVSGFVARVEVTQKFHNPFKDRIEAVYTFPLSQNSAVDDMLMTVGKRTIRGQIKKREEARRIYEAAKQAGHVASLLDQERPNIFTQSVANIMPGENVDITIRYVEVLKFEDAWYEFSFPTVVGPRYIPGSPTTAVPEVAPENKDQVVQPGGPTTGPAPQGTGRAPDTNQVPDASRITPPIIAEGMRAGHDISVSMRIDAGVTIRDMQCKSHEIRATHDGRVALVRLKEAAAIPNKDFVVRYTVATDDVQDAVLTHAGELGRYATLILQPPGRVKPDQITPKELVFVLDTSGSMGGAPIEKAKATMMYALDNLNPRDTFNFITFAGETHVFFPKPVPATPENVGKVQEFLATRKGAGGTEMMKAILAALEPSDRQDHMRIVCFMTDGYVGNDMQILDEIQRHPNARVFSFGIGSSVNRYLLDGMAHLGRGEVEYIPLNAAEEPVAKRFYERMRYPVLTDITLDWGGLPVTEIVPKRIPDLFSAKPVVVHAKATGPATGAVTLRGKVAGEPFQRTIDVTIPEAQPENEVLAPLWARAMIQQVMNQDLAGIQSQQPREDVQAQITDLGLRYRLVTQFTSFVAVEELIVTEGDTTRTIAVPVEMPEGVSYEGIFGDRSKGLMPGMGMGGMGGRMTMAYSIAMPAPEVPGGMGGVPGGMPGMGGGMPGMGGGMPGMPTMPGMPPVVVTAPQGPAGAAGPAGPRGERGPVGQPDANLTPEQKREFLLNQRLDAELLKLAQDPAAKGKAIEVTVWLSDDSPEMIAKLKELGLTVIAQAKAVRMVIGRVNAEKLEELALADGVRFVEPMRN